MADCRFKENDLVAIVRPNKAVRWFGLDDPSVNRNGKVTGPNVEYRVHRVWSVHPDRGVELSVVMTGPTCKALRQPYPLDFTVFEDMLELFLDLDKHPDGERFKIVDNKGGVRFASFPRGAAPVAQEIAAMIDVDDEAVPVGGSSPPSFVWKRRPDTHFTIMNITEAACLQLK